MEEFVDAVFFEGKRHHRYRSAIHLQQNRSSGQSRRFGQIVAVARRKVQMLDNTRRLEDLRAPPGNRLEALGGDRKGQYSIRINDQFRICFAWRDREPYEVEIVDYH